MDAFATPAASSFAPLSLAAERDRRSQPRLSTEVLGLAGDATLSQGVHVRVLNVSSGGALVELDEYIRPGTRSALKLTRPAQDGAPDGRVVASGQIVRCWVDRLAPLRYRAAVVFAAPPGMSAAGSTNGDAQVTMLLERPA